MRAVGALCAPFATQGRAYRQMQPPVGATVFLKIRKACAIRSPAKRPGLRASFCQALCIAGTTVFAGEPAPTSIDDTGPAPQGCRPPPPVVGAGSPAKGPGLRASFCQALCIAGTTVFAGEPAPTSIDDTGPAPQGYRPPPPVVGAGSPAKGPGLRASFCQALCLAGTTVFAGKPAPTLVDDAGPAPQGCRPPPPVVGALCHDGLLSSPGNLKPGSGRSPSPTCPTPGWSPTRHTPPGRTPQGTYRPVAATSALR